jgi:hypothetical protein
MADVLRTGVSVREQEVHIERPDGLRGIALVDIEAIKDSGGNVVGAVNCFQDITERKRSEAQIVNLAREAEHRTKNIMATVLATVRLSHSDTSDGLKQLIEGRIDAHAVRGIPLGGSRASLFGHAGAFGLQRGECGARAN